jgi:hypothetical protein
MTCAMRFHPPSHILADSHPRRANAIRDQRGQALVELGLIIVVFVTLVMGIIELGRTWMVANMITQAARDGARAAAVTPPSNRTDGIINDWSGIYAKVRGQITGVLDSSTADALSIVGDQPTVSGIPTVRITVSGTVPYIFHLLGPTFTVNREVSFRDEGR